MTENNAKSARIASGLSAREAAELIGVAMVTWQVWEGQTKRKTEIPSVHLELFQLKTGTHPTHVLIDRRVIQQIDDGSGEDAEIKRDELGEIRMLNEATKPKSTAASSGQVDQIVMCYAKDFDPDTPVIENCKYMAALGRIQDLERALSEFVDGECGRINGPGSEWITTFAEKINPWKPIATAPTDRRIDIWTGHVRMSGCYWDGICNEWRTTENSGHLVTFKKATHWMPMPDNPNE